MDRRAGEGRLRPYVLKSLPEHERLVALARFPWILRAWSWFLLFAVGAGPSVLMIALYLSGLLNMGAGLVCLAVSVVGLGAFLLLEVYMQTTEFAVTSARVLTKRGLIARETAEIPLHAIEKIELHQSILARFLGFGRIVITGSGGAILASHPADKPLVLRQLLARARQEDR
ncbi:MAG: PH domain-containing protein [Pseudomonadota bacterium]